MGKKYDAYQKAAQAEAASAARWNNDPTDQNERDTQQAEAIANATWVEFTEDPKG